MTNQFVLPSSYLFRLVPRQRNVIFVCFVPMRCLFQLMVNSSDSLSSIRSDHTNGKQTEYYFLSC